MQQIGCQHLRLRRDDDRLRLPNRVEHRRGNSVGRCAVLVVERDDLGLVGAHLAAHDALAHDRRVDDARAQRDDADSSRPQLCIERFAHADDAEPGCAVRRHPGDRDEPGFGGSVDDRRPAALCEHPRHKSLHAVGHAEQVHAGIAPIGLFIDEDPADTQRVIDVNIGGVLTGTRLALQRFLPRNRGHIVNLASSAGQIATAGGATYAATKHAVVGFTRAIRAETLGTGVRTTIVMPGLIRTDMIAGFEKPRGSRIVGPEAVADAIVDALHTGREEVFVPRELGPIARLIAGTPPAVADRIKRAIKADSVMAHADMTARAAYVRRMDDDGVRSPVLIGGPKLSDEAVVFVHGNPDAGSDWEPLMQRIGEFATVVAPDMPGFGGADKRADQDYTLAAYALTSVA